MAKNLRQKPEWPARAITLAEMMDLQMADASEAQFQRWVITRAEELGWAVYHTHDSRRSQAGWPDLVLCKPPRLLFWELKRMGGRVEPEQERWIARLKECGESARVVYPCEWRAVEEELSK